MKTKIIGILSTKNVLSQGYPFLESIYSFLNWGDKLYIGDDSNDGTEKILKRVAKNKKIKLLKIRWEEKKNDKSGEMIGRAYNDLLTYVRKKESPNNWIFELQSNEIVHEDSYRELRSLPEKYTSGVRGFSLPYVGLVGTWIVETTWKFRLASLQKNLIIESDGASLYSKDSDKVSETLRNLIVDIYRGLINKRDPWVRKFYYVRKNLLPVCLKQPIFRYGAIFPDNRIKKLEGHLKMYTGIKIYYNDYLTEKRLLQKVKENKITIYEYYRRYSNYVTKTRWADWQFSQFSKPEYIKPSSHPKIMQNLLNRRKYIVRRELIEDILKI